MRRNQWYVLAMGLILLGMSFVYMGGPYCLDLGDPGLLISCTIRKYAYAIPGLICFALGFLFMFCAGLEKKQK